MSERLPISVVILAKNEANNIAQCVRGAAAFDEVVVVDSASDDDTVGGAH
jgi:glycosyltransferase involved in cell wall biosynthesis